jgi:hypothetical protein
MGRTGWGEVGISGKGEVVGKGCRRVNMVKILCICVCKYKTSDLLKLF